MVKITHKANIPQTSKKEVALKCPMNKDFLCNNPICRKIKKK
jgi:hypothetical protein